MKRTFMWLLCAATSACSSLSSMPEMTPDQMSKMGDDTTHTVIDVDSVANKDMMMPGPLGISMDRMGSGTTWIPDAVTMPAFHEMLGSWTLMVHGFAFAQVNHQSGPRGDTQFGSLNWGMLMLSHDLGGGKIQARTMLSLDALTVSARGYPLLLQTGETYEGAALRDRQHPHDFFMELGVLYEKPVAKNLAVSIYAAPSGEPALGPVAFMHRPSAMDDPTAPISHHWQDATHISFGVVTAGIFTKTWKVEGSAFNGHEPDERRWNFDAIKLDSYSARMTLNPALHWSMSAGYGFLKTPEAASPLESMRRVTASVMYGSRGGVEREWTASLIYGANHHSDSSGWSSAVVAEGEFVMDARNTVLGRIERAQKSRGELLGANGNEQFNVGSISAGYVREVSRQAHTTLGLGMRATVNIVPAALEQAYGSRNPAGVLLFARLRPYHLHQNAAASMPRMPGM